MSTLPKLDSPLFAIDKVVHLLLFMIWELIFIFESRGRFSLIAIFFIGIGFGATTEVLQLFTKDRMFDWIDMIYDSFGLFVGIFVWIIFRTKFELWKN